MTTPGTYRESDQSAVTFPDAIAAWVVVARPALHRTARTYNAVISYTELSEEAQATSGIRTKMLIQHWIGQVLGSYRRVLPC